MIIVLYYHSIVVVFLFYIIKLLEYCSIFVLEYYQGLGGRLVDGQWTLSGRSVDGRWPLSARSVGSQLVDAHLEAGARAGPPAARACRRSRAPPSPRASAETSVSLRLT